MENVEENEFIFVSEEARDVIDVESVLPKKLSSQDEVQSPSTALKLFLVLDVLMTTTINIPILVDSINVDQQGSSILIRGAVTIESFRKLLGLIRNWSSLNVVGVSSLGLMHDGAGENEDPKVLIDALSGYRLEGWKDVEVMETIVRISLQLLKVSS